MPDQPAPGILALSAPSDTVRGRLIRLVLVMLLPVAVLCCLAALVVYQEERQAVTSAALETAKALSLVTDRELAVRAAVLRTLARSQALAQGDLAAFHAEATAVAPQFSNAIVFSDPTGQQLLNTRVPFGTRPLPRSHLPPGSATAAADTLLVSPLYMAPIGKQFSFAVHIPVMRDGQLLGFLGMGSHAVQMQRIFEQQPLPEGWVGSVLDAEGTLVARNINAAQLVGRRATPDMLEAMAQQRNGVHTTQTLDGTPVYTVFNRAPDSAWTVLIGLPRAAIQAPAWRALLSVGLVALVATAITLLLALRAARRITTPVLMLHAHAEALGKGELIEEQPTGLAETDTIQRLLAQASRDRREADDRLRSRVVEAVSQVERAQRAALGTQKLEALGRLTGGIAHDFNNLLQTMTTGLQLAQRTTSDPRSREALAGCQRAVAKAVKLTRQLMTFGRTQPGHQSVLDLGQQLHGMRDLLDGAVRDGLEVSIEVQPDLWPVQADAVQLEMAVLNLVLNARDAIVGSGRIVITAENRPGLAQAIAGQGPGDHVSIRVRDDGAGIAPELLARVFEPFFTTKPVGQGSGLGLAQVYGFAKSAGGAAAVSSEPGQGTEVEIVLPRCVEPLRSAPSATPAMPRPDRYQGTVLLVEDDPQVRRLVAQALQEQGFHIVVASDADEALALARSRADLDAVLSDVVMPGATSGIDLARTLKVMRPALPVILASGAAGALLTLLFGPGRETLPGVGRWLDRWWI